MRVNIDNIHFMAQCVTPCNDVAKKAKYGGKKYRIRKVR